MKKPYGKNKVYYIDGFQKKKIQIKNIDTISDFVDEVGFWRQYTWYMEIRG